MDKRYRVIFHGVVGEEEVFREQMGILGTPPEALEKMLHQTPIVLKGDLDLRAARRYADKVQEAGGKVKIEEYGEFDDSRRINRAVHIASFKAFTRCAECGFKQPKSERCVKCGLPLR